MWSLPDIKRMNKAAVDKAFKDNLEAELNGEVDVGCAICNESSTVESRQLWYDIFSEEPKGVVGLCEEHDENYGPYPEGYFFCESCNRLFINNYTWENYFAENNDGEIVCLNCRAKEYVADPDNWLQLESVQEVGEDMEVSETDDPIDALDFDEVRKSPHLIAVEGPIPEGLKFVGNAEFDSMTGSALGGGMSELRGILRKAKEKGHSEAILILDAAYQFAVSIGVYVRE